MQNEPAVAVLRLGHRPGRDERMTTHVALTARALGADRVILPAKAADAASTARDVTERFGGPFTIDRTADPLDIIRDWSDAIVHLTMYGQPIQNVVGPIRATHESTPLLVVVGGGKVPFEVYERADWNVGVTNQPHSEVAALAVFLDRLFDGRELDRDWENADRYVVPQAAGKRVESTE
ncbi:MAG: tRNA (cytidine(56)-2'-O)-methyltransferase [Halobacteriales archaeon]|nr:tRNA (cytidine(56)-2'-O)-methyltransferase [Halobacteriales archaeon]